MDANKKREGKRRKIKKTKQNSSSSRSVSKGTACR